jgi:hypothetical protein
MFGRPILVSLIGGLSFICGLLLVIFGLLGYLNIDVPGLAETTAGMGIGTMTVGLIALIIGYGFLMGWSIFWYLGVIVYALILIGGLYTLFIEQSFMSGIVAIVISLIILAYLFSSKVKTFFLSKD